MRVQRALARAGIASRRKAEELISEAQRKGVGIMVNQTRLFFPS